MTLVSTAASAPAIHSTPAELAAAITEVTAP